MTIQENRQDDALTVRLEGRLDTTTAPDLEALLKRHLPTLKELTVDIENLDYLSSAGLRVLLFAQSGIQVNGGTMVVCHPNELVQEVFDVTGFGDLLDSR